MIKIAFNVITKGDQELHSLKRLITSVASIFEAKDIFITANHKHQRTESWCKKEGINFSFLKWDDNFAQQRNFNFSQVPEEYEYHLWADADDVLVNPKVLLDIAKVSKQRSFDAVFFTYWYGAEFEGEPSVETFIRPELTQTRERLLKRGAFIWKKRIHETPVPFDGEHHNYTKILYSEDYPIAWLHLGADRDISVEEQDKRTQRNLRLLEMELEEERKTKEGADPRTILYLMKILVDSGDTQNLVRTYNLGEEYLQKSGWDEERMLARRMMSRAYGELGDHIKEKAQLLLAIDEYEKDPLTYFYLARAYFNLEDYSAMKHWLDIGLKLPVDENQSNNILELKIISSELMLRYYMTAEKDVRKAYNYAKTLNTVHPTEQNQQNEEYLYNQKELDLACEELHKLLKYIESIGAEKTIPDLISKTPLQMQQLPFAINYNKRYSPPRIWADDEICYYANFGRNHFESWGPDSLIKGIGGSEVAVINLTREWAKKGYKVTVYADTGNKRIDDNGVTWLPFYMFNSKDRFNIFIQWRSNYLAQKLFVKKFLVDLHDLWDQQSYLSKLSGIDRIMIKSQFHRKLADKITVNKFALISNGITL